MQYLFGITPKKTNRGNYQLLRKLVKIFNCYVRQNVFDNFFSSDSGEWCYYGRNEFLISCHIQEIPENGADVAHLNAVHGPNMLTGNDIRYSRQPWASFGIHSWNAQLSLIFLRIVMGHAWSLT